MTSKRLECPSFNFSFFLLTLLFFLNSSGTNALKLGVKGDDNKYCIVLDSPTITGSIRYKEQTGGAFNTTAFTVSNSSASVVYNGTMESKCGKNLQQMTIEFVPLIAGLDPKQLDKKWKLTLLFNKTDTNRYALADYFLAVTFFAAQNASEVKHLYKKNGTAEWGAQLENEQSKYSNGYTCSENKLTLSDASSLSFDYLKLVAFYNNDKADFRDGQIYENCPMDVRTSDLVPIIVGALLAGLVIVVLIAYLIGRARAKRQGYTSV
uniref:Lysosome-associated membrane glycoprotein 1 n=1 Tax=Globodera pallida TaxID=36090 RepID=A0A183CH73_GLOPA